MGLVLKNSPYIMGIDLGTSTSSVAIFHRGKAEVIEIEGQKVLPSVVYVQENGELLVGEQAKSKMLVDPENTVSSIKREMGNAAFTKEFHAIPGMKLSPADFSAKILEKLRNGAQEAGQFDYKGALKYAVICVPANFDDAKKTMTLQAGELAGLDVLYLLEEPVAAAIAYGFDRARDQTILVYDLGGGTFDVSILRVKTAGLPDEEGQHNWAGNFEVLAKEGIPKLGGDDFDMRLMGLIRERFKEQSGLDVLDLQKDQGISKKTLREAQQKLKETAERVKKELSEREFAEIRIPSFLKDEGGQLHNIDYSLTRSEFEDSIKDLVLQSGDAVRKALESAGLGIDDIDRIILVGGSTRVPLVKEMITEIFSKEPYGDLDPDIVVATGAAIFGAWLGVPSDKLDVTETPEDADKLAADIRLQNKVTHFLGIEVHGGRFSKLIDKGLELTDEVPVITAEKEYTTSRDAQTELRITVYQSVDEVEYVGEEGSICIGEFFLTGIPSASRGRERITVHFEINQQNLLRVVASSKGDDKISKSLEIQRQ